MEAKRMEIKEGRGIEIMENRTWIEGMETTETRDIETKQDE